ncbi:MAG: hypothetical protein ACPGVD_07670 [Flavobacteriales bacterium]
MKVLVNGIGNIGTTLLSLLVDHKKELEIEEVIGLKNSVVSDWNKEEIAILKQKGVRLIEKQKLSENELKEILDSVDYIMDANTNSIGLNNKELYAILPNLKGCSAQGSEKGFGIPFMSGINNECIAKEKFVQIVSCNTHSLSTLLSVFSDSNFANIKEADFVIVRRSEDIGNHQRLVAANVVSRHLNSHIGTHHAIDVKDLFRTINLEVPVQSSDITTPSQLMHSVRFNIKLSSSMNEQSMFELIDKNDLVSTTNKFDSNVIFELGRRYSKYGRLYSHVIINSNNILFDKDENRIKGWGFIPQEGNTIISTLHAFLLQVNPDLAKEKINFIKNELIRKSW